MGQTTYLQMPYPDPTSSVDVAADIKNLAQTVDTNMLGASGAGYSSTGIAVPSSYAQYPLTTLDPLNAPGFHISGGNLIIDRAGTYLVFSYVGAAMKEAAGANAYIVTSVQMNGAGVMSAVTRATGSANATAVSFGLLVVPAGASFSMQFYGSGAGTSPLTAGARISAVRISN